MKKVLISLLLIMIFAFTPTSIVAFADTPAPQTAKYYNVNSEGVVFYDINLPNSITSLFEIPNTYYVKKLNGEIKTVQLGENILEFQPVSYRGINGYIAVTDINGIKVKEATQKDLNKLTEQNAYYVKQLTIKDNYEDTVNNISIAKGTKLDFYGRITTIDKKTYYVFYMDNKFIQIPKEYFGELVIEPHTFPQDNNSNVITDKNAVNPYNKLSTNILIISISIASVVLIIILYKPKKQQKTREDYYDDDNYYENYKDHYHAKKGK